MKRFLFIVMCFSVFMIVVSACSNSNYEDQSDIGEKRAKELVVKKIPGAKEEDIKIKKETSMDTEVYKGSVKVDKTVYEFEIEAANGAVSKLEEK